jgi:hypothetical protein
MIFALMILLSGGSEYLYEPYAWLQFYQLDPHAFSYTGHTNRKLIDMAFSFGSVGHFERMRYFLSHHRQSQSFT